MNIDFDNSKFTTTYSFAASRSIVRVLSDAYSKQNCNVKMAPKYAAKFTKGRCLYCGQPMYALDSQNTPKFSNLIHYDHIYPASLFNLFEVGNVAIACETCNLAKSNMLPMDYYDLRTENQSSLLIYDREEFEVFLNKMTKPYVDKWPKHYEATFLDLDDEEFKEKVTELLYEDVQMTSSGRYNYENSANSKIWAEISKKAGDIYTPSTAKDVDGRLGFTNEFFEIEFGEDKLIGDCKLSELNVFITKVLLTKYDSKNEVQKYRMLFKLLIEVLNEELMEGQLEDFYKTIPTYSSMKKSM